jgi:hypothetical protein
MSVRRWQDWGNVILGLWMIVSPWALGFAADNEPAAWSAWALGAAIVLFAGTAMYMPKAWEEGLNAGLGLCLIAAPWVLGFSAQERPTTNAIAVGVLVTALGLWAMLTDTSVQKWWHERHGGHGAH